MKYKQSPKTYVVGIDPSPSWTGWAYMEVWHDIVPWDKFDLCHVHAEVSGSWCEKTEGVIDAVRTTVKYMGKCVQNETVYIEEVPPSNSSYMGNQTQQQAGVYWALCWEYEHANVIGVNNTSVKKMFEIPTQLSKPAKKKLMVNKVKEKLNDPKFDERLSTFSRQEARQGICDAIATGIAGYYFTIDERLSEMEE